MRSDLRPRAEPLTVTGAGIVIDTFAQQRDLQKQIKEDMENVCFICGIDRNTFDRKHKMGFEYHRSVEHGVWHYLNFIIHIRTKDHTELTVREAGHSNPQCEKSATEATECCRGAHAAAPFFFTLAPFRACCSPPIRLS